jgi:hypothetical protein
MKKLILPILIVLLIIAGAGGTYYFYTKYQDAKFALDNPEIIAQGEVKAITDKLGMLIELPEGEEPSVATVLDKEKLMDQAFFAKSENGDKVVIYTKASKAILYRESTNKIIEVAPITITQPETTPEPTRRPTPAAEETTETP